MVDVAAILDFLIGTIVAIFALHFTRYFLPSFQSTGFSFRRKKINVYFYLLIQYFKRVTNLSTMRPSWNTTYCNIYTYIHLHIFERHVYVYGSY